MMFSNEASSRSRGWRERAVQRSLAEASTRSAARVDRLVDAARALAEETRSASFTVSQVASRAGLSLKSFYRCFAGKDELLLALLAEESVVGAALLQERMADADTSSGARLRAFIDGIFEFAALPSAVGYARVLAGEHRRLAEAYPEHLRAALAPLVLLVAAALPISTDEQVAVADRTAETVFGVVLAGIDDVTLGRVAPGDHAAHIWQFCWYGLRGPTTGEEQQ